MILPGTGRGTAPEGRGGGGASLRKPAVYAARKLRSEMSLPELLLWRQLRAQRQGFKVRRQHPIGSYVADFYVSRAKLLIEVDGEAHSRGGRPQSDEARDRFLALKGYDVVHFAARDVLNNLEGVLASIAERVRNPLHHPTDGPPPRAGEDL